MSPARRTRRGGRGGIFAFGSGSGIIGNNGVLAQLRGKTVQQHGPLVVFGLDRRKYALRLTAVERIIRAVDVTPIPDAPRIICGVINMHGKVIAVVDLRRRLHLPDHDLSPDDRMIIASTSGAPVALIVDQDIQVVEPPDNDYVESGSVMEGLDLDGIVRCEGGVILIYDLDRFLHEPDRAAIEKIACSKPQETAGETA